MVLVRGVFVLAGVALNLAACGGGSDSDGACAGLTEADLQRWEGTYQLTSFTENQSSCDAEGPSILASQREPFFFLRRASALGRTYLWLLSCTDAADCADKRTKFDQSQTSFSFGPPSQILFQFTCSGTTGSVSATIATTGFSSADGTCSEPSISQDTLSRDADGNARVESREQIGDDYPAVDGYCTTDAGSAASANKPCTHYRALVGTLVP